MRLPTPRTALLLSLLVACLTIAMKGTAWWLTGSVGYLSDALESLVNLAGASFALAMVTYAHRPPDAGHPFGHGKAEYFSAAFEGGLIFIAALAILFMAGQRLISPLPLEQLGLGTALSTLSTLLNLAIAQVLFRVARVHRSLALEADARHLMADVWTTVGVVAGVGLASWTGRYWLDPVVAIAVALNILREGWNLVSRAASGLMDPALDADDVARLHALLGDFDDAHGCKTTQVLTRQAGAQRFAQVNLLVPAQWSVKRAHDLADRLEAAVGELGITLTTHIEPMSHHELARETLL